MDIREQQQPEGLCLLLYKEREMVGECLLAAPGPQGAHIARFRVEPAWRRRGYGTYLMRQLLSRTGGFDRREASLHTAPLPGGEGALAFAARFGFAVRDGQLERRRAPAPSAVGLTHEFLKQRLGAGAVCLDATCGNGGDTQFLCELAGPSGRVLAMDIQQQAVDNTNARLAAAGLGGIGRAVLADHARLAEYVQPGSLDCAVFNFGYLPGADHSLFSTEATSLPALEAALEALRPGGVLAACLYSGGPNGSGEKEAVLRWMRALPLTGYTVLVLEFANWADTAPLPCFVLKNV